MNHRPEFDKGEIPLRGARHRPEFIQLPNARRAEQGATEVG